MADRHPAPRGSWLGFICSGRAHHSTSTTLAFTLHCIAHFVFFSSPSFSQCYSTVLSFHFGINPFHPSGSFCSSSPTFFSLFRQFFLCLTSSSQPCVPSLLMVIVVGMFFFFFFLILACNTGSLCWVTTVTDLQSEPEHKM